MPHPAPNDYLKWSVLSLLFFFPFALVPIFIALSSRAARRHGDDVLADVRAGSARRCFWVVVIVGTFVQANYIITNWDELCAVYQQQRAMIDEQFGLVPPGSDDSGAKADPVDKLLGDAPARDADAPARDADAPARDADAPARDADAPARDADAPARDADAPARDADAPARDADAAHDPEPDAVTHDLPAPADDRIAPKDFVDRLLENSVEIIVDDPEPAAAAPKETLYEL